MGCFLGCFGLSNKRKRRKPAIGALLPPQRHMSYKSLDSIYPDVEDDPISSDSDLRIKPKQRSISKIRKKVTFNLNVEAYEPLQPDYHLLKSEKEDDEEEEEKNEDDAEGRLLPPSDSTASRSESYLYPSNHRYQNCIDDEQDEIEDEESDLEYYDDDDEEEEEEDYVDAIDDVLEELPGQPGTSSVEDGTNNLLPLGEARRNVRDRSNYARPVLNPVQNLSQWKAVKARTAATKYSTKENAGYNQEPASNSGSLNCSFEAKQSQCKAGMQEVAVDASLSNWINTTKSSCSEHAIQERALDGSNRLILDFDRLA